MTRFKCARTRSGRRSRSSRCPVTPGAAGVGVGRPLAFDKPRNYPLPNLFMSLLLPEDPAPEGFSNIGESQQISYHLLETHLEVADLSLDEAFRRAHAPEPSYRNDLGAYDIGSN